MAKQPVKVRNLTERRGSLAVRLPCPLHGPPNTHCFVPIRGVTWSCRCVWDGQQLTQIVLVRAAEFSPSHLKTLQTLLKLCCPPPLWCRIPSKAGVHGGRILCFAVWSSLGDETRVLCVCFALSRGGLQDCGSLCDDYVSVYERFVVTFHSVI